jgi:hypothetical protein
VDGPFLQISVKVVYLTVLARVMAALLKIAPVFVVVILQ